MARDDPPVRRLTALLVAALGALALLLGGSTGAASPASTAFAAEPTAEEGPSAESSTEHRGSRVERRSRRGRSRWAPGARGTAPRWWRHETDGSMVLPGGFPIHDLIDIGVEAAPEGPYATVAGLVLDRLGHIPEEPGARVSLGDWTFEVSAVERHAIIEVRIRPATTGSSRTQPAPKSTGSKER